MYQKASVESKRLNDPVLSVVNDGHDIVRPPYNSPGLRRLCGPLKTKASPNQERKVKR